MVENAEFLLGTVTAVSNANGIRIQIDGQDEPMTKYYKMMLSGADAPSVNDRVVVMKQSGTYIILGKIGTPNQANGKVNRSGDTMTGNLTLANSQITQINQDFNLASHPSSNQGKLFAILRDVSSRYYARFRGVYRTSGEAGMDLGAIRDVSGTTYYNGVTFYLGDDGSPRIYFDFPEAWRKALGLGTNGAFPITVAQGGTGQAGLITTSEISEIVTAASGFTVTSAYFAQFGKVAMVSLIISSNNAVTTTSWTTWATLVEGKRPARAITMDTTLTSFCQLYASGDIDVSETVSAGARYVFSATYLLP